MNDKSKKSRDEMLKELKIPEDQWDYFSNGSVVIIYDKFKSVIASENTNKSRLIYFLNLINKEFDKDEINDISDFRIDREDIIKLDGEKFIEDNKDKIKEWGINLNSDLNYFSRKNQKAYGLTVVKCLAKLYGYDLKNKVRSDLIDNEKHLIRYYYTEKLNLE